MKQANNHTLLLSEIDKERKKLARLQSRVFQSVTQQARASSENASFTQPTTICISPSEDVQSNELRFRQAEDALFRKLADLLK